MRLSVAFFIVMLGVIKLNVVVMSVVGPTAMKTNAK